MIISRIINRHWILEQDEENLALVPNLEPRLKELYRLILRTLFGSIYRPSYVKRDILTSTKRIESLHRSIMEELDQCVTSGT